MPDKNPWRKKIKESDPEKYAAYLERQKRMNQTARQEKKLKWQKEPHNCAIVTEHERQLALARPKPYHPQTPVPIQHSSSDALPDHLINLSSCPHPDALPDPLNQFISLSMP
ncbi:hypothetical protein PoB_004097300 [Plakobranchus ocellatus]|uniref:Uncharacterized protein n=1 Tax=Plakobranchus ocellatus TaxID=259542 RepID=A0AAV4B4H0_9GAST|nr:hypothetical protein PoB_004097300 [Plakobranchus ocellatus]